MKAAVIALFAAAIALPAVAQDYAKPGPFQVESKEEGPDCTSFVPTPLGNTKHPVILWGNGTRSKTPAYAPMLKAWASQGFVVIAANTNTAGTGAPILACLDYLQGASAYAGKLDLTKIGVSGHSQGGGGTLMAARDARITVTAPIEAYTIGLGYEAPATAAQHAPMLLLSGGADTTAIPERNQKPVFDGTNVPVVWATLKDATHAVPATGDSGEFRIITTAWFRAKLMGDKDAAKWFDGPDCGVCKDPKWTVQRK